MVAVSATYFCLVGLCIGILPGIETCTYYSVPPYCMAARALPIICCEKGKPLHVSHPNISTNPLPQRVGRHTFDDEEEATLNKDGHRLFLILFYGTLDRNMCSMSTRTSTTHLSTPHEFQCIPVRLAGFDNKRYHLARNHPH